MIAKKITKLLEQKKISQKEFCDKINLTPNGLRLGLKKNDFKLSTLLKIAEVLNVPIGYFLDEISLPAQNQQITQISNGNGNKQIINLSHEIDILKKEIEGLKKELAAKNETISILLGSG